MLRRRARTAWVDVTKVASGARRALLLRGAVGGVVRPVGTPGDRRIFGRVGALGVRGVGARRVGLGHPAEAEPEEEAEEEHEDGAPRGDALAEEVVGLLGAPVLDDDAAR